MIEVSAAGITSEAEDSGESCDESLDRPKERWAPLGAAANNSPPASSNGEARFVSFRVIRYSLGD